MMLGKINVMVKKLFGTSALKYNLCGQSPVIGNISFSSNIFDFFCMVIVNLSISSWNIMK